MGVSFEVQCHCRVDAMKTEFSHFHIASWGEDSLDIEARSVAGLEKLQHNQPDNFTFDERPRV